MDYLAYYFNAMAFCMAVERLLQEEVPAPSARVAHLEPDRIASHLFWLGTAILDIRAISPIFYALRDRKRVLDLFEMSGGQRMHPLHPGRQRDRGRPPGWDQTVRRFAKEFRTRIDQMEDLLDKNEMLPQPGEDTGIVSRNGCSPKASPGRCCARRATPRTCARRCPTQSYDHFGFKIQSAR